MSATGGVFLSICDDWMSSSNLALLAEASIKQESFTLSRSPVASSIEVAVNSQPITDFSYDAAENTVIIGEAEIPEEGYTVDITYSAHVECD